MSMSSRRALAVQPVFGSGVKSRNIRISVVCHLRSIYIYEV